MVDRSGGAIAARTLEDRGVRLRPGQDRGDRIRRKAEEGAIVEDRGVEETGEVAVEIETEIGIEIETDDPTVARKDLVGTAE